MAEPAFVIPVSSMSALPLVAQEAIYKMFGMSPTAAEVAIAESSITPTPPSLVTDDGPVELTLALVRRLARHPIDPKTLAVLRAIAQSETPKFHLKDVIAAVPGAKTYKDIKGSWSGITRRTRNILNDVSVDLIWWNGDAVYDGDLYVDQEGEVAKLTHDSLRTHFGL